MQTIRVGSRDSQLAVAQSRQIMGLIQQSHPGLSLELVTMKTRGDRLLGQPLSTLGGKGFFTRELDDALLDGRVDICVHSQKDVPIPDNPRLPILAVSRREDPRDVLVLPPGRSEPDFGQPLGTSSLRRRHQLTRIYPDWRCEPVRGNILSRLRKLDEGEYGGLVLAAAGLIRLGLADRISRAFAPAEMIPAAGQGILAVQGRADREYPWLEGVGDPETFVAAREERHYITELHGGCSSPVAAYGRFAEDGEFRLAGLYVDAQGRMFTSEVSCPPGTPPDGAGLRLAARLREEERLYHQSRPRETTP